MFVASHWHKYLHTHYYNFAGPFDTRTANSLYYMYMEASGANRTGEVAAIDYKFFSPVNKGCFSLYYHMYGADMGSLIIGSTGTDGSYKDLWTKSGNQGQLWLHAFVPITRKTDKVLVLLQVNVDLSPPEKT